MTENNNLPGWDERKGGRRYKRCSVPGCDGGNEVQIRLQVVTAQRPNKTLLTYNRTYCNEHALEAYDQMRDDMDNVPRGAGIGPLFERLDKERKEA